jgi:hypothetical protein
MAAAAAGVAAISGASNFATSLASTGLQVYASKSLQQNEQQFNTNVMSRAEKAFTDVGLPKYQAYTGNSGNLQLPGQQFHIVGSNFYSAGLVGQNVPFLSTPYQSFTHTGRPNESVNESNNNLRSANSPRAGLGFYSRVAPWNEPRQSNNLTEIPTANLAINRRLIQSYQQQSGNMNTLPKTRMTRTLFPASTSLLNFTSASALDNHKAAARLLQ